MKKGGKDRPFAIFIFAFLRNTRKEAITAYCLSFAAYSVGDTP